MNWTKYLTLTLIITTASLTQTSSQTNITLKENAVKDKFPKYKDDELQLIKNFWNACRDGDQNFIFENLKGVADLTYNSLVILFECTIQHPKKVHFKKKKGLISFLGIAIIESQEDIVRLLMDFDKPDISLDHIQDGLSESIKNYRPLNYLCLLRDPNTSIAQELCSKLEEKKNLIRGLKSSLEQKSPIKEAKNNQLKEVYRAYVPVAIFQACCNGKKEDLETVQTFIKLLNYDELDDYYVIPGDEEKVSGHNESYTSTTPLSAALDYIPTIKGATEDELNRKYESYHTNIAKLLIERGKVDCSKNSYEVENPNPDEENLQENNYRPLSLAARSFSHCQAGVTAMILKKLKKRRQDIDIAIKHDKKPSYHIWRYNDEYLIGRFIKKLSQKDKYRIHKEHIGYHYIMNDYVRDGEYITNGKRNPRVFKQYFDLLTDQQIRENLTKLQEAYSFVKDKNSLIEFKKIFETKPEFLKSNLEENDKKVDKKPLKPNKKKLIEVTRNKSKSDSVIVNSEEKTFLSKPKDPNNQKKPVSTNEPSLPLNNNNTDIGGGDINHSQTLPLDTKPKDTSPQPKTDSTNEQGTDVDSGDNSSSESKKLLFSLTAIGSVAIVILSIYFHKQSKKKSKGPSTNSKSA